MEYHDLRTLLERPANSMLRGLLNAAPVAAGLGLDGKIVYANPAFAQMWGFEHTGQMLGKSLFELVAPDCREIVMTLWRARREHPVPWEYDLRGVRPDGSVFPYRITSMSFETEMGKATFAYFVPIDTCIDPDEQLRILLEMLEEEASESD